MKNMKKPKITLKNIFSYIEGNSQKALEHLNLQPQHIKEQIAYRRLLCKDDCAIQGKCIYCGCEFYGKTSVQESCNKGMRFPNLMGKQEWEEFKFKNNMSNKYTINNKPLKEILDNIDSFMTNITKFQEKYKGYSYNIEITNNGLLWNGEINIKHEKSKDTEVFKDTIEPPTLL